ncbi:hypothetical protein WJX73_000247 [Symbiochloris irregularis]|uniref:Uncharacterized protein n=1 Tax=Symbiochloris irregularis TaxID=706552 RepID=A0AAW1NZH9_9CHLO
MMLSQPLKPSRRRQAALEVLVVAALLSSCVSAEETVPASKAEQLYQKAIELRSLANTSARHAREATELLQQAAGALYLLGSMYHAGDGVEENHALGYHLTRLAAEAGLPQAQAELGFRMGLGLLPPPVQHDTSRRGAGNITAAEAEMFEVGAPQIADSLLQYYFAAGANDSLALLAMGYRHLHGLGVPKSCGAAALYYHPVALSVIKATQRPQGLKPVEKVRLGQKVKAGINPSRDQELLHYQWFADLGNLDAQRTLARILQQGNAPGDLRRASRYFRQAAEGGDAEAMAHLGHMYASGTGVKASNGTALAFFSAAAERGHPSGLHGLGFMHLSGRGVRQDFAKAFKFFAGAAEQGHVDAWFHLGVMHLKGWGARLSRHQATQFFAQAAHMGHLLAMYNLAVLHLTDRHACAPAVQLLKAVAEKGTAAQSLTLAREAFERGQHRQALMHYLRAADAGFELGQANAAWMLQQGLGFQGPGRAILAVRMWERAAQQGNVGALLSLGDAHYYGRGSRLDWAKAGKAYMAASQEGSAQALFNLGFQHQYGAGLPQDLHLAKRYYDRALSAMPSAYLPVILALNWLWLHSWWLVLAPKLPSWCSWLKDVAFVVQPPAPTSAGDLGAAATQQQGQAEGAHTPLQQQPRAVSNPAAAAPGRGHPADKNVGTAVT